MAEMIDEFERALGVISHCRAGWDFQMSHEQRQKENLMAKEALDNARTIWAENPDMQDDLRAAFKAYQPLETMSEIEGN